MNDPAVSLHRLLEAASFAARAHHHQVRKDGRTPYVGHVYRVCLITRQLFGIDDPTVLITALLHDTIEDTTTDFDDLAEQFGEQVAGWVALLTKDKRRLDTEREAAYCADLAEAPWQVKVCKLADVYDNLLDSRHLPPASQVKTLARSRRYLEVLDDPHAPAIMHSAYATVRAFLAEIEARLAAPPDSSRT